MVIRLRTLLLLLAAALAAALLASCSSLGYLAHTAWGGAEVLLGRRPIDEVLADPATPEELAAKLRLVLEARDFAAAELALPVGEAYSSYVDLDRPYAVWNVVAAPELSVAPLTWCFPFAGCVAYRGYFSEERARRFAERLARGERRPRGVPPGPVDVDVSGTAAYSTLGWFADPVLSTFVGLPEPRLAGLLFHELAHRRLYVDDDTAFNESFATAVELAGVGRWLAARGEEAEAAEYRAAKAREDAVIERVLTARGELAEVFAESRPEGWKRQRKAEILEVLADEVDALGEGWGVDGMAELWFGPELDNADLAALGNYRELLPGFERLLAAVGGDLERFYERAEELAGLPAAQRRERLGGVGAGMTGALDG